MEAASQSLKTKIHWRKVKAGIRDTWLLLRQFRWPLLVFCLTISGGGLLYYYLSQVAAEGIANPIAGIYHILGLTFLNPTEDFPQTWYLEIFYFIMPVIGIGILAQGVADFGVLFFNRRERGKEWEMAVASTFHHHIVLIGLGHLGYRVARNLYQMGEDVVVVEQNPKADLVESVKLMGIPVIQADGVRDDTLEAAGIRKARSIILCTQNDSLNLQIALKARSVNPKMQVVVRIFDESFAQALHNQFGFIAMSATGMAAPAFAAASVGADITPPITIEGEAMSLAKLNIPPQSRLVGQSVAEVEGHYDLSIVLLRRQDEADPHPQAERILEAGDVLAVLGGPQEIRLLMQDNRPA